MAKWYNNISESLLTGIPIGTPLVTSNENNPIVNIVEVQGGWHTVPSASDMYDINYKRLYTGQIIKVTHGNQLYEVTRIKPDLGFGGGTPGYTGLTLSHSFALTSFPGSDGGSGVGFPYAGSDNEFGDPAQAIITGSLLVSGSGFVTASSLKIINKLRLGPNSNNPGTNTDQYIQAHGGHLILDADNIFKVQTDSHTVFANKVGIGSSFSLISNTPADLLHISGGNLIVESSSTGVGGAISASNIQVDNNINVDGALSFDGFTFSDGNVLVTSGSTVFGDSASQDTHKFTGSLYVSGGIYLATNGSDDIKFHGTASHVITSSYAISASNVITSSYAISASNVITSSYAITSSYVESASYAISSSYVESASYAISKLC